MFITVFLFLQTTLAADSAGDISDVDSLSALDPSVRGEFVINHLADPSPTPWRVLEVNVTLSSWEVLSIREVIEPDPEPWFIATIGHALVLLNLTDTEEIEGGLRGLYTPMLYEVPTSFISQQVVLFDVDGDDTKELVLFDEEAQTAVVYDVRSKETVTNADNIRESLSGEEAASLIASISL
ncbi:MAG: hypothetical protein AAFV53_01765 [Myxococcota bacterium]